MSNVKTFYHYSESPNLTLNSIETVKEDSSFKPGGFWVSDDSRSHGWKDWCLAEEFRLESLRYRYHGNY